MNEKDKPQQTVKAATDGCLAAGGTAIVLCFS